MFASHITAAMKQKLLIIVGPTASGKSALAVSLARRFNGEVVSADSRQVYKGLDIGAAKVTKREMDGIRHYLLDEVTPHRIFTAQDFVNRAQIAIKNINKHGKLPIVAGGTGFYIDALTNRISLSNIPPNLTLRSRLEKKTTAQLFTLLRKRDPHRAKKIEPLNKRRIIRALEIATARPRPMIGLRNQSFDAFWIGLRLPNENLQKKICARAAGQVRRGLMREVKKLRESRISLKRIRGLGFEYSLALDHADGKISKQLLLDSLATKTWQYARRQITYWRRNPSIKWYGPSQTKRIEEKVRRWIQK